MSNLIVLIGNSGSGKTTVAQTLVETYGFSYLHCISFLKRQLESHYELEFNTLDTQAGKQGKPKGCNLSYQEIMVNLYKFWANIDPFYSTRVLQSDIPKYLAEGNLVLDGVRNKPEVEIIISHVLTHNVYTIEVTRESATPKESDLMIPEIIESLKYHTNYTMIANDRSKENLKDKVSIATGNWGFQRLPLNF